MSTSRPARRAYHHGELPTSLLTAAGKILEKEGVAALSVREAARREKIHKPWLARLMDMVRRYGIGTDRLVEIGPGFGRWTAYLLGECAALVGVDVTARCVEVCRERFAAGGNAQFWINHDRAQSDSYKRVPEFYD